MSGWCVAMYKYHVSQRVHCTSTWALPRRVWTAPVLWVDRANAFTYTSHSLLCFSTGTISCLSVHHEWSDDTSGVGGIWQCALGRLLRARSAWHDGERPLPRTRRTLAAPHDGKLTHTQALLREAVNSCVFYRSLLVQCIALSTLVLHPYAVSTRQLTYEYL